MASDDASHIESPPSSFWQICRRIGPGLIIAASIVGSGELIATTKTGAQAGFWLLWLILIGCVIKVFVQIEFGRYAVHSGKTTMTALAEVPGPKISGRGNWIVWYWFLMFIGSLGQLGGIVGGVGQALSISIPLTQSGRDFNAFADTATKSKASQAELASFRQVKLRLMREFRKSTNDAAAIATYKNELNLREERIQQNLNQLQKQAETQQLFWEDKIGKKKFADLDHQPPPAPDDKIWAGVIAVLTSLILFSGRYSLIQVFSTIMVGAFTLVTLVNLGLLQSDVIWRATATDIFNGMQFRLPPSDNAMLALGTALATFGIIGVGASELVSYPYWCLEKGYARFTGKFDGSESWFIRARGWLRVMQWDAWCSMVIYTLATVAFYLLGAAILGRANLDPEGPDMIRTLAVMYEPVFGDWAALLFLFGSFAVLYSTFFVANASHARVFSDTLGVLGVAKKDEKFHRRRVRILSAAFPLICLGIYIFFPRPTQLVLLGALLQSIMLPMLAIAGLYFRYVKTPKRLMPSRWWDLFLWLSALGMMVAGVSAFVVKMKDPVMKMWDLLAN